MLNGLQIYSVTDESDLLDIIFKGLLDLKDENEDMFQDLLLDFLDKLPDDARRGYVIQIEPIV